jgi:hypothetical protein
VDGDGDGRGLVGRAAAGNDAAAAGRTDDDGDAAGAAGTTGPDETALDAGRAAALRAGVVLHAASPPAQAIKLMPSMAR